MQQRKRRKTETAPEYSESAVRDLILRRLTRMASTRAQLEKYLTSKQVAAEMYMPILDRYEEVGLINDREYAEMWVRSRRSIRGSGPLALARELSLKGVDPLLAQQAIESRVGDDLELATALAQRKYRSVMRYEPHTRATRLATFLIRRGYSTSVAFAAAHDVIRQTAMHDGDSDVVLASYEDD